MKIKPLKARYSVENSASGIKISIPTPRNWFVILFTSAWLGGWFFGFKSAPGQLLHSTDKTPDGFLSFWLIAWTIGGIAVASNILW
jgi:hypothetical protein